MMKLNYDNKIKLDKDKKKKQKIKYTILYIINII